MTDIFRCYSSFEQCKRLHWQECADTASITIKERDSFISYKHFLSLSPYLSKVSSADQTLIPQINITHHQKGKYLLFCCLLLVNKVFNFHQLKINICMTQSNWARLTSEVSKNRQPIINAKSHVHIECNLIPLFINNIVLADCAQI